MDVFDTGEAYRIVLDLPNVSEGDIEVSPGPTPGTLLIQAESPGERSDATGRPLRLERPNAGGAVRFQRILPIAWDAEVENAEFEFEDGTLTVKVPKRAENRGASKSIGKKSK